MKHTRTQLLTLLVVAACLMSALPGSADSIGTRIEAGERECYSELLEAGGTLAFSFRVTDGGSFDIDAEMFVAHTPPLNSIDEASRFHFNDFFAARRDRQRIDPINSWRRSSDGKQSYTARSVQETKHGLPVEVTVCFDNSFSTVSPKWILFSFMKRDVLEVDPDAVNKVDAEMEERLHSYGTVLFGLAQDTERLKQASESDRVKSEALSSIMAAGLGANLVIIGCMAVYQYYYLTRFLARQRKGQRIKVAAT